MKTAVWRKNHFLKSMTIGLVKIGLDLKDKGLKLMCENMVLLTYQSEEAEEKWQLWFCHSSTNVAA